jgi:hypothetical protein
MYKQFYTYHMLMRNNTSLQEFKCSDFLGNYSVTGFELILRRKMSHYIITYYFPAGKTIEKDIESVLILFNILFIGEVHIVKMSPSVM